MGAAVRDEAAAVAEQQPARSESESAAVVAVARDGNDKSTVQAKDDKSVS